MRSYLRDSGPSLMSLLLVSPVASGKRVLQAISDDSSFDGQLHAEFFASVYKLLGVHADLFHQIAEKAVG